jgi:uncharacterized cupredoxin-like copper-binding protein
MFLYRVTSPFAAAFLMLFAAACTETRQQDSTASTDTTAGTQSPGDTAATGGSAAPADTVQVNLTNFNIDMPNTLQAGPTVFQVENAGQSRHNFEVERGDIEKEFEQALAPGAAQTLRVDLEPGEYEVYCPVANHESRGMALTLTVNQSGS